MLFTIRQQFSWQLRWMQLTFTPLSRDTRLFTQGHTCVNRMQGHTCVNRKPDSNNKRQHITFVGISNKFLDISSETLNCLKGHPESPLSRHNSIRIFNPVKANPTRQTDWLRGIAQAQSAESPFTVEHFWLIKSCNLTRLSHNLCKALFEKRLNSLYRNDRRHD
jgi:hypothetical protein